MTIRIDRLLAVAVVLLCTLACHARGECPEGLELVRRPNIVLMVTDDQRADAMGCAGNAIISTPHLDALARDGVRFTHAFVTTPICAASRVSILTGLYERTHDYTFGQPALDVSRLRDSYPFLLRDAGYRTGFVGKLGVKMEEGTPEALFDSFRPGVYPYFAEEYEGRHLTEVNTDRAIEFLDEAGSDRPFCLSISYMAPHAEDDNPDQYVWPASCDSLYADVAIPSPPTSDPAFFDALPEFLRASLNRERWHWRFDTPEKHARMVRGYYRMISGVDAGLGRIREALEERGLAENTVVIVIGDNGYFLGERGYAGKWSMHDLSTRVPLLIHDPRSAERGGVRAGFALNVDLAPTILDLAGVPVPDAIQGRSLLPLVANRAVAWRDAVFTEHRWDLDAIPRTEALRTERWKYIRYLDHPEYEELYDLQRDPREECNLADDEHRDEHRAVLRELRQRCERGPE
jgi:arylsulfatase A-like enzyme